MTTQKITLPDLGVESAEVVEIMFAVGDTITENDNLVLLESDKASMEVPAGVAGTITEIHLKIGDSVSVGVDFVSVTASDSAGGGLESIPTKPAEETNTAVKTEPVTTEAVTANVDENLPQQKQVEAPAQVTTQNIVSKNSTATNVYAGPAVRKLCRELGVDVSKVTGTAVNRRIVKDDVHAFVKQQLQKPAVSSSVQQNTLPPLPDMTGKEWGATHTEDLTKLQKVSIPQLCYNTQIPQVTQFDLADITDTESYRSGIKGQLKKEGVSLTIVAFVIKALAYALKKHPLFNSHLSDDHTQLIMRDEIHIGMAVSTDQGLVVPVIRHADQKGLVEIATDLAEVAGKARNKKLSMSDMTGAGMTISSQGNMGGTYFTPLVNVPQVAILGLSEATIQPRWNVQTNTFEPRLMLPLSLSYDHRVINGADAAVFTRYVATLLSDMKQVLL